MPLHRREKERESFYLVLVSSVLEILQKRWMSLSPETERTHFYGLSSWGFLTLLYKKMEILADILLRVETGVSPSLTCGAPTATTIRVLAMSFTGFLPYCLPDSLPSPLSSWMRWIIIPIEDLQVEKSNKIKLFLPRSDISVILSLSGKPGRRSYPYHSLVHSCIPWPCPQISIPRLFSPS